MDDVLALMLNLVPVVYLLVGVGKRVGLWVWRFCVSEKDETNFGFSGKVEKKGNRRGSGDYILKPFII